MAIKAQTARLKMETAIAAGTNITAITTATPPVATSTAHGLTNGDVFKITGISAGMVEVNNRAFVAANIAANTVELKGVVGAGFTTYTTGGAIAKPTMTDIAEVKSIKFGGGQSSKIETTNLRSFAKEYVYGLRDIGSISLEMFFNNTDAGQIALRNARDAGSTKVFSLQASDATVMAWLGVITGLDFDMTVDGAWQGNVNVELIAAETWFA